MVQGSGSLSIKAKCGIILSETYAIENVLTIDWQGFITSTYASTSVTNGELSFSNNGAYRGAYIFNQKPNTPYVIELEYIEVSGNFTFGLGVVNDSYDGSNSNYIAKLYYGKTNNDYWGCISGKAPRPVTGDKYRFEVYDDYIAVYKNNALLSTYTPSTSPLTGRFAIIGTDYPYKQRWRNIKIKLL